MLSYIKKGLVAGIIFFVWASISWMILPFHKMTVNSFKDAEIPELQLQLLKSIETKEPHIYTLPAFGTKDYVGPFAFISLVPSGLEFGPKVLVGGFINDFILGCFLAWIISLTGITAYWDKVRFMTITGFAFVTRGIIAAVNYWGFAGDYALVDIIDGTFTVFLGSLYLAKD